MSRYTPKAEHLYVKQLPDGWWIVDSHGKWQGPHERCADAWSVIHNAPYDRHGRPLPACLWPRQER